MIKYLKIVSIHQNHSSIFSADHLRIAKLYLNEYLNIILIGFARDYLTH